MSPTGTPANLAAIESILNAIIDEIRAAVAAQEANLLKLNPGLDLKTIDIAEEWVRARLTEAFSTERVNAIKLELEKLVLTGKGPVRRNRSALA